MASSAEILNLVKNYGPWVGLAIFIAFALIFGLWVYYKKRLSAAQPYHLAKARFTQVGDFKIHYVQEGRGPHLMLIHGLGATTYCWRFIFEELTKSYTVTALDLPGFGESSKLIHEDYNLDSQTDRVLEFCDKLGIEQCRLVGCSMGGTIALWMAKKHPDRFFEMAVLAPATNPKKIPLPLKNFGWSSGVLRFGVNRQLIKLIMGRVFQRKSLINDESIQQSLIMYQDPKAVKTFIKSTEVIRDQRLPHELRQISSRKLLLYGLKDKVIPESYIGELEQVLTNTLRVNHPNAGHHVMEDEPEWTLQHLQNFFAPEEI